MLLRPRPKVDARRQAVKLCRMSLRVLIVIVAIAIGLTVLFWGPLWQGHGLIGGDLYTYFFPQKVVYAEQLAEGRLPLWNDLVGFGYPMLAESQTGVFYPSNQWLYRQFDVNTAYNISQIGHYVLAFVFTWLLMRRLGLSATAAVLSAIVFVYGWFPPRICLEWAIIGGVYFPLALWCVESYLQTARKRWLALLALSQGIHLLAGHFNLAFITQLTCVAYAGLRIGFSRNHLAESIRPRRAITLALVIAALFGGFALAAVQVLPTWELKQLSQREEIGADHDPGYGHIPPWYLSQIVAPWLWYADDMDPDQALQSIRTLTIASNTNKAEAHLYFGMVPLLLIGYRLVTTLMGSGLDRRHRHWLWLGLAAMVYATGWLLPITRHLPGFSFFMGPGRYGIVTTLAAALLAGAGFDQLLKRRRFRSAFIGLVVGLTIADLFWVSRQVTYAVMVEDPPINHVEESAVHELLLRYEAFHGPERRPRMFAPGANLATLTGFAAYPAYLGIGPAAYYDPVLMMPEPTEEMLPDERTAAQAAQQEWLREASFTHVLAMEPLAPDEWPTAQLVWQGFDRLFNPAWGRFREPLFLYELTDTQSRIRIEGDADAILEIKGGRRGREQVMSVELTTDAELVWAELAYPGWVASVKNDEGLTLLRPQPGLFRRIPLTAGKHEITWSYKPESLFAGCLSTAMTVFLLLILTFHGLPSQRLGPIAFVLPKRQDPPPPQQ